MMQATPDIDPEMRLTPQEAERGGEEAERGGGGGDNVLPDGTGGQVRTGKAGEQVRYEAWGMGHVRHGA